MVLSTQYLVQLSAPGVHLGNSVTRWLLFHRLSAICAPLPPSTMQQAPALYLLVCHVFLEQARLSKVRVPACRVKQVLSPSILVKRAANCAPPDIKDLSRVLLREKAALSALLECFL